MNQARLALVDLPPQIADTRLHDIPLHGGVVAPDMLMQRRATQATSSLVVASGAQIGC